MFQQEFGISAHEALYERPTWELDNLLEQRKRKLAAEKAMHAQEG